ncbi:hypothetical protein [Papillibacter cinnamivorans]|uniref:Uncharacterized protein n=1 Tax=Papillibacter cinnamivorans DSM 12816 TaxID=1122930 RepID=A0A1W2AMV8_9FIRM|nr:hypothetical protein [Papillibacter cinnamivorans]SMC61852.1 hypothetical protein SAMN02745168_1835 [Papillibacter cinnamivorans DSM 12816]
MNLNRKDLKKTIYDFNAISNRLMKVDFEEYLAVLKKFLNFVEGCPIVFDYINDCGSTSFDIEKEVDSVSNSYGSEYFDLGETEQEEVANVYHLLKHIVDHNIEIHFGIAMAYASESNKYQDLVKGFNERVVLVLIRYIESYLTKIGIDMGIDETVKYSIKVNNGQVNLAIENSVINATQNNGISQAELKDLLHTIKNNLPQDITPEDKIAISDSIEVIESELAQPNPRKSFLRTALSTIQAIKGTVEFGAAVTALVTFVSTIL